MKKTRSASPRPPRSDAICANSIDPNLRIHERHAEQQEGGGNSGKNQVLDRCLDAYSSLVRR